MFGIFKRNKKEEIEEVVQEETIVKQDSKDLVEPKEEVQTPVVEEKKSIFAKAFSKTFENFKSVVPKKQEKIDFETIEEMLIESDIEYEIIEKAMDYL